MNHSPIKSVSGPHSIIEWPLN